MGHLSAVRCLDVMKNWGVPVRRMQMGGDERAVAEATALIRRG